jgi:hypothetical protein
MEKKFSEVTEVKEKDNGNWATIELNESDLTKIENGIPMALNLRGVRCLILNVEAEEEQPRKPIARINEEGKA